MLEKVRVSANGKGLRSFGDAHLTCLKVTDALQIECVCVFFF